MVRLLTLIITLAPAALGLAPSPQPPWTFSDARVMYQPAFVRAKAARAVTPDGRGLTLLSLFGWTLGGVFVVDWVNSPIGRYREVAVLSGLVARGFALGAWASHIVVDRQAAIAPAREIFGLPAVKGSITFDAAAGPDPGMMETVRSAASEVAVALKTATGTAVPGVLEPAESLRPPPVPLGGPVLEFTGENVVRLQGWNGWTDLPSSTSGSSSSSSGDDDDKGGGVNLPSFSGRLQLSPSKETPLLFYPLRLGPATRLRLRPSMRTICSERLSGGIRGVLGGPVATPCIQVDGVRVVAGRPVEI